MSNFSNGINNGSNTPVIYQTTDANRPTAPLAVGSLFVSQTSNILQRWDGSGWVTVGGSGTGSVTSVNGQTGVVVLTTTDIAEGTNLYYTDARARAALSAGSGISYNSTTGAISNGGVLSFNGNTGAITYTAPVTSVNSQTGAVTLTTTNIAEGTNLYYTDGRARGALSAGSGISYNQTTGQITNSGVLSVNGQTGAVTLTTVTSVNGQTGAVTLTTTDIAEGTNLYYTDARARAALSSGSGISYNQTTGQITNSGVLSVNGQTGAVTITSAVASVNGQTGVVVLTTTDIAEGTNLYYTDARARAALSAGTGISYNSTTGAITNAGVVSFNGSTGAITYTAPVTSVNSQTGAVVLTTTNIAEGTNLYYTDGRARAALSAGTGVTYNNTTGVIAIGQSVATSATPVFAGVQANGSGGLQINNSSGTLVATFGSANTTNASVVGGLNVGGTVSATLFSGSGTSLTGVALLSGATFTGGVQIIGGNGDQLILNNTGQPFTQAFWKNNSVNIGTIYSSSSEFTFYTYGSQALRFYTNAVERVNIPSNGSAVAFYTSVSVTGSINNVGINTNPTSTGINQSYLRCNNTGGDIYIGVEDSTGSFFGATPYAHIIYMASTPFEMFFGGAKRFSVSNTGAGIFSSTLQATQFNGVLVSGNSLAGTLTGTGTNVGAQWKFISDNNTTGAFIGIAAGEATGDAVFAVGANKKLVFGIGSAGTSRAAEIDNNSVKIFATAGNTSAWVSLGSISGVTSTWLFGGSVTGATVAFDTTAYLNITHNGTNYKLALAV